MARNRTARISLANLAPHGGHLLAPERFGWGPRRARFCLLSRNFTYLPKTRTRAERRHKLPKCWLDVLARDGYACRKCGVCWSTPGVRLTPDHVIPHSCGGDDSEFNLVTLCQPCNTRRGAYYPNPITLL